jgi:hypothetical protein
LSIAVSTLFPRMLSGLNDPFLLDFSGSNPTAGV